MASLEFGQAGFARILFDLIESSTLFHNARLENYHFYVHKKTGSRIYTILLNYVCIVIELQFAIKNLVYEKGIF